MLDDFLVRSALAGIGVAIATAPLGCFVVWRRMAYFGDAAAHAAILGVALALAFEMSIFIGVMTTAMAMGLAVSSLSQRGLSFDSALGVLAHGALAAGLVAAALLTDTRIDLMAFLFGDILTVTRTDLLVIWGGAALIIAMMLWRWSALLTVTLNPDLARAAGLSPRREELILTLAIAVTVAVALKVVGAMLISAMLIMPAAAARNFSRSPEVMAGIAAIIGIASTLGGLQASIILDAPTGPMIVCVAAALFMISLSLRRLTTQ